MLKVTQETLNLGFMRRIMLSVLVWAIGVIYHVDVYATWHIGDVANCFDTKADDYIDDSDYIFRSGKRWNGDGDCCGVDVDSIVYYAPVDVLNNMVRVYNTSSEGRMLTLLSWAEENNKTGSVVCMDSGTRDAMIAFFAQSCYNYYPHPEEQPNFFETICESNDDVRFSVYKTTSTDAYQKALTSSNVHVPVGDSKWHNRRRFKCDVMEVSDFYGGAFTTGTTIRLIGYAYPVLLVNDGFSSAYENLYTGDCRLKDSKEYRLNPTASCWGTDSKGNPIIDMSLCLEVCPAGYYCTSTVPLGDFFLNSSVSATGLYERGRRKYGGALQCEPGSYSGIGYSSCNPCASGTYQSLSAQSTCNTCPSTSVYNSSNISSSDSITGTTSNTGAKSDTECFVDTTLVTNGNLLEGKMGLFTFTGACYYS